MIKLLAREIPEKVEFYLRGISLRINQIDFFRTLREFPNIKYGGEYRYPEDLPQIYNAIHLTWCIDLSQSWYNSRWLLPNGFYESGLFAVPMLSLKGSEIGELIEKLDVGWTISQPYVVALIQFLKHLTWKDYVYKKEKLASLPKSFFQGDDQFKKMCHVIRKPIPPQPK
jgi:succinoglycan biosynthesis protein ExoL